MIEVCNLDKENDTETNKADQNGEMCHEMVIQNKPKSITSPNRIPKINLFPEENYPY